MLIVAIAGNGILTNNMFSNTNIDFKDIIRWDSYVECNNCSLKVTDTNQPNESKKILQAKMIKQRRNLSYHNSKLQIVYNTIYSHELYENVRLIQRCNKQYYISLIQSILRSNNVSYERKLKIREFISRIII